MKSEVSKCRVEASFVELASTLCTYYQGEETVITYQEWLDFERNDPDFDYYEMVDVFLTIDAINRLFRGRPSYDEPNYIRWALTNKEKEQ